MIEEAEADAMHRLLSKLDMDGVAVLWDGEMKPFKLLPSPDVSREMEVSWESTS